MKKQRYKKPINHIYSIIKANPRISNKEIKIKMGYSSSCANHTRVLLEQGLIKSEKIATIDKYGDHKYYPVFWCAE